MILEPNQQRWCQLSLTASGFQLESIAVSDEDCWRQHAGGTVTEELESSALPPFPAQQFRQAASIPVDAFYGGLAQRGLSYGPAFRGIRELRCDGDHVFAEVALPFELDGTGWLLHPAFLDSCLHTYAVLADANPGSAPVPTGLDSFHLWRPGLASGRVHTVIVERPPVAGSLKLDIRIYGDDGRPAALLRGLAVRGLPETAFTMDLASRSQHQVYDLRWRASVTPEPRRPVFDEWCLISDRCGVADRLAGILASQGLQSAVLEEDTLATGTRSQTQMAGLVWLRAIDEARGQTALSLAERALELMQQLVRLRDTRGAAPRLWLVTRGSQGEDLTALMQAPLWGLGRSFALEYPDLWGGLVDLPATADVETMAVLLHRELCAGDAEDQVMWRDGHRFVPRLAPSPESVSITAPSALRDDASYWVVGGLGRLGILTAEALITAGARHLMLTGRREPDATAKLTLESLRERAQIHVMVADIGSEEATRAVIARVAQTMPPLRGVIHTAAVFEDALIANLTPGILSRVFRPKIKGSWNLHRATTALDLDFFILFSSVLSLWGAAGQAAYVAANSFLDALAHYRRALGLPATVFNWGPWQGQPADARWSAVADALWTQRATTPLSSGVALECLLRLRSNGPPQVVVTDTRWSEFARQFVTLPALYRELASPISEDHPTNSSGDEEAIGRHVSSVLGIRTIDPQRPLNELGLDSLLAVTLANRLRQSLGVTLPVARLLKGASVAELAAELFTDRPPPHNDRRPPRSGSPWLIIHKPRPEGRARLVCFPFAGGGAATFRLWADLLDAGIEVVAIEPPGRQTRVDEPPIREIGTFVEALIPELLPVLDRPFAVYGHCLGALTLYETVRKLIENYGAAPAHIFVSGARPPDELQRHQQFEDALTERLLKLPGYTVFEPVYRQPDEVFAEAIRGFRVVETERLLASPELRRLILPTIRADFEMSSKYRYHNAEPLDVPITCLTGINDTYVSLENAESWKRFTRKDFQLHMLDSEHFIVVDDDRSVIQVIDHGMAELR